MRKMTKGLLWAAGALLLAIMLGVPGGAAYAISCASGSTCTAHLTNTNVTGVTVNIDVKVDNTVAGETTITVSFVSDNLFNTPLGIDQFGYQSNTLASSLPGTWAQADCNPPGPDTCHMDGFGDFLSEIDDPAGTDLSFSFVLASQVTDFPANSTGAEFAAHIRYSGGCSAFVSDGTASSTSSKSECLTGAPTPATLLVFGPTLAGLGLGIGAWRMRRRRNK